MLFAPLRRSPTFRKGAFSGLAGCVPASRQGKMPGVPQQLGHLCTEVQVASVTGGTGPLAQYVAPFSTLQTEPCHPKLRFAWGSLRMMKKLCSLADKLISDLNNSQLAASAVLVVRAHWESSNAPVVV